jgi:putative ATP-binding cassette transporter
VSDEEPREVLVKVNLPDIVERCGGLDVTLEFGKILWLGEQQRLAITRVLLAKPREAALRRARRSDEATKRRALSTSRTKRRSTRSSPSRQTLLARLRR